MQVFVKGNPKPASKKKAAKKMKQLKLFAFYLVRLLIFFCVISTGRILLLFTKDDTVQLSLHYFVAPLIYSVGFWLGMFLFGSEQK